MNESLGPETFIAARRVKVRLRRLWLDALGFSVGFAVGWLVADALVQRRYQPGDEDEAYWYGWT